MRATDTSNDDISRRFLGSMMLTIYEYISSCQARVHNSINLALNTKLRVSSHK